MYVYISLRLTYCTMYRHRILNLGKIKAVSVRPQAAANFVRMTFYARELYLGCENAKNLPILFSPFKPEVAVRHWTRTKI